MLKASRFKTFLRFIKYFLYSCFIVLPIASIVYLNYIFKIQSIQIEFFDQKEENEEIKQYVINRILRNGNSFLNYVFLDQEILTKEVHEEFQRVFSLDMDNFSLEEKINAAKKTAKEYNCIVLLKTVTDIATDGDSVYTIEGGNPGLTKGGTGDVLAGLTASLYTKNDPLNSAVVASFVLKKTADTLSQTKGNWYNIDNLIDKIPEVLKQLI
jgi:hypothetical protein